jgi:hypothetical protein
MKEFSSLLTHQPWNKYFENSKNGQCHSELLKISQFFGIPPRNAKVERFFLIDASPADEEKEHVKC